MSSHKSSSVRYSGWRRDNFYSSGFIKFRNPAFCPLPKTNGVISRRFSVVCLNINIHSKGRTEKTLEKTKHRLLFTRHSLCARGTLLGTCELFIASYSKGIVSECLEIIIHSFRCSLCLYNWQFS